MTFFFRFMRQVIDGGHLYLAKPPLFELVKAGKKENIFIYDEGDLDPMLDAEIEKRKAEGVKIDPNTERYKQAGFTEQKRYKGLGEVYAESPGQPVRKMIDDMLKFSNNYVAEMLTKNLAAERGAKPGTMLKGLEVLKEYARKWNLPKDEYQFTSPSGLSRQNKMSARALTQTLTHLRAGFTTSSEFITNLPITKINNTIKNKIKKDKIVILFELFLDI
jgi:D-alanyl-D-alanine carboxypeptidase